MDELVVLSLPIELIDRADNLAKRTGRCRADVIADALHRGLRDEERVQSIMEVFDDLQE